MLSSLYFYYIEKIYYRTPAIGLLKSSCYCYSCVSVQICAISKRDIPRRWMTLNIQDIIDEHNSKCYCSCPMESTLVRRKCDPVHKVLSHQSSYDFVKSVLLRGRNMTWTWNQRPEKNIWSGEVALQILWFYFLVLKPFVTDIFLHSGICNVCPRRPWRAFQENKSR